MGLRSPIQQSLQNSCGRSQQQSLIGRKSRNSSFLGFLPSLHSKKEGDILYCFCQEKKVRNNKTFKNNDFRKAACCENTSPLKIPSRIIQSLTCCFSKKLIFLGFPLDRKNIGCPFFLALAAMQMCTGGETPSILLFSKY